MDFVSTLTIKYPYLSNDDIQSIVDKATMFYCCAKYPCEPTVSAKTRLENNPIGQQWVITACEELIERLGFSSAVAYKENGVSWSFDNAQISDRLMNLIKPTIGVLK